MNKIVNPGTVNRSRMFCKIKFEDSRLSISGVVGPRQSGNCSGGCGQIVDTPVDKFSKGWNQELLDKFYDVWHRWHLNDLRAGCEHQRAKWNPSEQLTWTEFRLKSSCLWKGTWSPASINGLVRESHPKILRLLEREYYGTRNVNFDTIKRMVSIIHSHLLAGGLFEEYPEELRPFIEAFCEEVKKSEQAGWVRHEKHPRGLLCKPCDVCGYAYGSKWLHEDVPQDVLDFLAGLPETEVIPAWV
jgi:hypothetical protein